MITTSFRFILITFLIGLTYGTPVERGEDESPMTMKGFNNSLGTFVEFSGRASIALEDWTIYASFNLESFLTPMYVFKKVYKSILDNCAMSPRLCPEILEFKKFASPILQDGLIETDDPLVFKIKPLSLGEDEMANKLMNKSSFIDSTINIQVGPLELDVDSPDFEVTESPYWIIEQMKQHLRTLGSQLKRSQDAITEALASAYQRQLSPFVLTTNQLEAEMLKIQSKIPRGRRLPFDQSTISDIYRIASVVPRQLENHLVFRISVPLIDVEQFNVCRLTPIPRVDNGTIQLVDTETPYLGINDHLDRYFPLQNLDDCTELAGERFVCKHNQITYGNGDDSFACSLAAIRNQSSKVCTFRQVERSSMWTQLVAPNSWMVALTKELTLMGVCSGETQELRINGSGVLTIRSDCIVRSSAVTLQGEAQKGTPSKRGYASLQLTNKPSGETGILESFNHLLEIVTQLKVYQENIEAVGDYPMSVVVVCPVIVLIALLISLTWLYLAHRRRQLQGPGPQNPVSDIQDSNNEIRTSNLPLLEKQEI
uniref:Iris-A n=1 Tax=Drosophila paralutea TaxID=186284 RepID=Q30CL6_9MUSC|nr:Iris-A [Drosophila paralutea]